MVKIEQAEALHWLKDRTLFGIKMGLNNMLSALGKFGNPHLRFKSIHVAGTNGKGTTSAFLAKELEKKYSKVGLYTSPHLVYLNERISMQSQWISNESFIRILQKIRRETQDISLTYFEVVTLIAFIYFDEQQVDYAVIETGLGGRLDATNVIVPDASIITGIGKDHEAYLGDSIEKITLEKCGIIKPFKPVFVGHVSPEVLSVIENISKTQHSQLHYLVEPFKNYLHHNYLLSKFVLQTLFKSENSSENIPVEMLRSILPARQSFVTINSHHLLIDGAHNEDGMTAFIQFILKEKIEADDILFGCVADKKTEKLMEQLQLLCCPITLVLPEHHRGQTLDNLIQSANKVGIKSISTEQSAISYLDKLVEQNGSKMVIICGSLYLAGEVYRWLDEKDFVKQPFRGLTINQ